MKKIIITAEVDTDNLEDSAQWDAEEAVKDTLKEWGYKAEVHSRIED